MSLFVWEGQTPLLLRSVYRHSQRTVSICFLYYFAFSYSTNFKSPVRNTTYKFNVSYFHNFLILVCINLELVYFFLFLLNFDIDTCICFIWIGLICKLCNRMIPWYTSAFLFAFVYIQCIYCMYWCRWCNIILPWYSFTIDLHSTLIKRLCICRVVIYAYFFFYIIMSYFWIIASLDILRIRGKL